MQASPELAQSFGAAAAEYERVRPDWPAAAVDRAVALLGLEPDADVVDLAAGTGKLTRLLAERFDRVVAVEPDPRMRALLDVEAHPGTAERIPLAAESADAVCVGDAFHWFDAPAALTEIARVLRPRGGLVLLWNDWWKTEPPIPEAATALLREPYERSGRSFEDDVYAWRGTFDGSPFEPPREEKLAHEVLVPAADLAALYCSTSSIASLSEPERSALRRRLLGVLSGEYRLPIEIELVWTRLR
ncbi:MAG TPA: class I SAM-dependent methyltransferase [Gaiellaceae bacterium]|nr:class I SAM-dependent methyltransferase [Gaiellaceae bacterium]